MKSFKLICAAVVLILSEKTIVNGQDNSEECTVLEEKLQEVLKGVRSLCGRPTSGPGGDCSCQADPMWTSIPRVEFGTSNLQSAGTTSFLIPSSIPDDAKEVLVYVEIITGDRPTSRSHIKLYTEEGSKRYEQYFVVRTWSTGGRGSNSDNMWFPLMRNRRLYLETPVAYSNGVYIAVHAIGYR